MLSACTSGEFSPWTVWVADLDGRVHAFDGNTGARLPDPAPAHGLQVAAVIPHDSGPLAVDFATGRLVSLGTQSIVQWQNEPHGPRLEEPCDLTRAPDGTVWSLGNDSQNLMGFSPSRLARTTGSVSTVGAPDQPIARAHGMAASDDTLWIARSPRFRGDTTLEAWDPQLGEQRLALAPAALAEATDVAIDDDTLWVADWVNGQVVRFTTDGVVLSVDDDLPGALSLDRAPDGRILVLADEGLFVIDDLGHRDRLVPSSELGTPRGVTAVF
jgi:sugar lactone lactonase YvrE